MNGIIYANKYFGHSKSTFQLVNYSEKSWLLNSVKEDAHFFLAKSSVNIIEGQKGEVTVEIPQFVVNDKVGLEKYV